MKKLISIAALGGMLLAACGGGSSAVTATVDGADITVGDVESLINTEDTVIDKAIFAQYLGFAIQFLILDAAAEADFGVSFTDEEIKTQADQMVTDIVAEGQTREEFLSERGISEDFLSEVANQSLIDVGIRELFLEDIAEATDEEVDDARNAARAPLTTACVSHILVTTEEEAQAVLGRLGAGDAFGALAVELSQDSGSAVNNGDLGCGTLERYDPSFRDAVLIAPVGEIHSEIVASQFGFHIVMVADREDAADEDIPGDEELAEAVRNNAAAQEFQSWFFAAIETAEVTVGEEYGVWEASPPQVIPPTAE